MKVHIFDTSALSDLAESQHARVRHRIIDEVGAGRVVVLGTHPLLWELPGAREHHETHYSAMTHLLYRLTRQRLMLRAPDRVRKEILNHGPLIYPDFVDDEHAFDPTAVSTSDVDVAAALNAGFVRGLAFHEAEKVYDTQQALEVEGRRRASAGGVQFNPNALRQELVRGFRRESFVFDLADHYARETLREVVSTAKLGIDLAEVNHRALPTAWSHALVHVARVRAVMVGGTRPSGKKSAGQLDLVHLSEAASYADVFVAEDRRLRAFARQVHGLRCEVLSFRGWAERLLT